MISLVSGLLSTFALGALAAPAPLSRRDGPPINVERFRLKTVPEYVASEAVPSEPSFAPKGDYVTIATEFLKKTAPGATFRLVEDHYVGADGIGHVYFKQTANDLDIDNADFNVNVDGSGSVFSYGSSFFSGEIPSPIPANVKKPADPLPALRDINEVIGLSLSTDKASVEAQDDEFVIKGVTGVERDPKAKLVYFQTPEKKLALAWRVETDVSSNWLVSYTMADKTKEILAVADYVAQATFQVYPWGVNDPTEGDRILVTDPWDTTASPFTWLADGSANYDTTRGNNGVAGLNWDSSSAWQNDPRPHVSDGNFQFPFSLNATDFKSYGNASATQLFYTANMYHDLLYLLGFDEKAGNFEANNNGKGGVGNDGVILNAQDGSGTNNANFATPPDGQPGQMRMYIFTETTPKRDCVYEADVILHEYTHGLSNRLTGGPANTKCLNSNEAGGMGEGWSDFMPTAIRIKANDTRARDIAIGTWVVNDPKGIREYPYSTSLTTNPYTFKDADPNKEVHALGTVWGTFLYEVLWNLIDAHGITSAQKPTLDSKGVPTDGRYLAMKLVMGGMALQPCNPTFLQARDAIIDADKALTNGANACALWKAFAKRGMGDKATRRAESFNVPAGVC
jgi:extracellular elastinolytic metalloproteinase